MSSQSLNSKGGGKTWIKKSPRNWWGGDDGQLFVQLRQSQFPEEVTFALKLKRMKWAISERAKEKHDRHSSTCKAPGTKGFNFRNKRDTGMCVVAINETIPSNYQKVSKKPHKKKQPQKQKMLLKPYYLPKIVSGAFHICSHLMLTKTLPWRTLLTSFI